jgi:hypothetical protein
VNEKKFYVYEHWRKDRNECFYVGKGHGRRAYDMRRGRNRWHKFLQAKLSALGTAIEVKIIEGGLTEREAFDLEVSRIAFWKNDGADLCNLTLGGDGPTGRKHTEEWKRANSERMKGRKMSAESRAKIAASAIGNKRGLGKKKPQHVIDALKAFHTGRKRTPEQCARIKAGNQRKFLGRHHTPEAIAKIKAKQVGVPKPEWVKAKMRKPKSEEHKRKLREINLGKTHNEETRKKLSEMGKADWARRKAEKAAINIALPIGDKE